MDEEKKKIFDNHFQFTDDGLKMSDEFSKLIKDFIERYKLEEYDPEEVELLMIDVVRRYRYISYNN